MKAWRSRPEKEIVASVTDKLEACRMLVDRMIDEESEIVTLIYGEGTSQEEADTIAQHIEDNYDVEVEVNNGEQPVYSFIVSVE